MSEVESFYLAVKDLARNRLSHHLIETDVLQDHLNILSYSIKFHNPKARLVYHDVHYYYTQGNVASAMMKYQDENTLAIIIHVPLTIAELTAPMSIYQVHTFPLISPDGENYHTILTKTLKYIIYNSMNSFYSITDERQNFPCTEYKLYRCLFKVQNSNMKLHAVNDNSCAMSLFSGDLNAIKKQCIYHVVFGPITPSVYQISPNKILLINVSSIYVERQARTPGDGTGCILPISNVSMEIQINATQSVYTFPCESTVYALASVYLSREFCDNWSPKIQLNVTYPYTMLILRHFFSNHTLLEDVNAALELDFVLRAQLPKLAIEKSEYDAVLASETESRLDFDIAINASQNQARIYDSLTTVVWQKMLQMATADTEFNLLSGFDWALVISMVITILNAFAITIFFLRLKAISMLLVGVRGAKANFIFSIPSTTTTKTTDISADMV